MIFVNAYQQAVFPNAYSWLGDGANEYMDAASLGNTNNLSFSIWVKGAAQAGKGIFGQWDFSPTKRKWALISGTAGFTDKLDYFVSADGGFTNAKQYRSSVTVFDSTWRHIVMTFATNSMKIYIDGSEDTTPTVIVNGTVNSLYSGSQILTLGVANLSSGTSPFSGRLAHGAIFNVALSSAQVTEIYNKRMGDLRTTSVGGNLILGYHFPNGQADFPTCTDYAGTNDATMRNGENTDINTDVP